MEAEPGPRPARRQRRLAARAAAAVVGALALALVGLVAVPAAPASANGNVDLQCHGTDQRTLADQFPRAGVIVTEGPGVAGPENSTTYTPYTVDESGSLQRLYPQSDYTRDIRLVAAWQNGTGCSGADDTRNAWVVAPNGRVFSSSAFSGPAAGFHGDASGLPLNQPIVGMGATTSGDGYWLVAADGGIFTYGDARFFGSTGNIRLNRPIVGMTATRSGAGYWLVAADGGVFSFGDAAFYGSTGGITLNQPISAILTNGGGYWMVASDGGIFAFNAPFRGSAGGSPLSAPIAGMVPQGGGYTLIGQDKKLYPFP